MCKSTLSIIARRLLTNNLERKGLPLRRCRMVIFITFAEFLYKVGSISIRGQPTHGLMHIKNGLS